MSDTSDTKELLRSLASDVAESVAYLHELGVEGLEVESGFETASRVEEEESSLRGSYKAAPAPPQQQSAALLRNANAETRQPNKEAQKTSAAGSSARRPIPKLPSVANAPRAGSVEASAEESTREHTEMATRRTTRKATSTAAPDTPAPIDTLFGEITPMDEASLPRSNETIEQIHADIGECIRCPLSQSRTRVVHTEGNREARLMFVGEAPGADEDASGRPFVGRAGQLLNKIIEAIGMKREDVLIGNVNRCRPPQNRTPTLEEAKTCKGFLLREIAVIRPDVIVVLGNTAMKNLLETKEGITKMRGQFQDYKGIKVMPTFHPAYLLRDPSKKRETWDDMKKVRDYLNKTKS